MNSVSASVVFALFFLVFPVPSNQQSNFPFRLAVPINRFSADILITAVTCQLNAAGSRRVHIVPICIIYVAGRTSAESYAINIAQSACFIVMLASAKFIIARSNRNQADIGDLGDNNASRAGRDSQCPGWLGALSTRLPRLKLNKK